MLTKSSIKFQIKNGAMLPKLQSTKTIVKNGLGELFDLYADGTETSKTILEEQAGTMIRSKYLKDGALSILNRASAFKEPVSIASDARLEMIESAQRLRIENEWNGFSDFQKTFVDGSGYHANLTRDIYGDLTTDLNKSGFDLKSKDDFVTLYNLGMYQGLLVYADSIILTVHSKKFLLKEVFRKIRFHDVRCQILTHDSAATAIEIDCKQSGKIAAYRANKKLSHLLTSLWKIPHWELQAKISMSRDKAGLSMSLKAPAKKIEHMDALQEESELTTQLKKHFTGVTETLSPICFGHQNWIFPDVEIKEADKTVYIGELDEHQLRKFCSSLKSDLGQNNNFIAVVSKKTVEKATKKAANILQETDLNAANCYIFGRQIQFKALKTHIKSNFFSS